LDPMDTMAYNNLAYGYQKVGDLEKSIWAINQCIHLAPNDANPYDTQGDLYAASGQFDKAIASYEKAVAIDSAFYGSMVKLGGVHMFQGRETRARKYWTRALQGDDRHRRAWARLLLATIPLYHGRADETLVAMANAIDEDRLDGYDGNLLAWKHWQVAYLHAIQGDWSSADAAFRAGGQMDPRLRVVLLAPIDVSRIESEQRAVPETGNLQDLDWVAKCWVEMVRGRFDDAAQAIDQATQANQPFLTSYTKGVAYLRSGRLAGGPACSFTRP